MDEYFNNSCPGQSTSHEDKKYELIRLGTFSQWPNSSSQYSTRLARAGFFYEGNADEVRCYVCGVKKSGWLETDDPIIVHKQLSMDCQFFSTTPDNIPVQRETNGADSELIQRLDNLELGDLSDLDGGSSEIIKRINSTPTTNGENCEGEKSEQFPHSRSANDVGQSSVPNHGQFSLVTDSVGTSVPTRSTSLPSSVIERNQADCLDKIAAKSHIASGTKNKMSPPPNVGGASINVGAKSFDLGKLRYEKNRLETFEKWPRDVKVPPTELAKSGFFYTGFADRVMCVFCKGALRNWEEGDRPNVEHRKHFPKCRHVLGLEVGNVPSAVVPKKQEQIRKDKLSKDVVFSVDHAKLGELGIITDKPKNPRYSIYSERLSTFKGWPSTKDQTPDNLAEAGFFYAGFGDNVKCFYCNGGLRNWEPGDEPWIEHAKWFKTCPFIKQVKGEPFILQVQHQKNREASILSQLNPSGESSQREKGHTPRRLPLQSDLLGLQRVEEREIRARMDSALVKVVKSKGMDSDVIARVLRNRLLQEGDDFSSATDLIEAIFKQEEEDKRQPNVSDPNEGQEDANASRSVENDETSADKDQEPACENEADTGKSGIVSTEIKENDVEEAEDKTKLCDPKKSSDDLEKENIDLKEQRLCKICMANDSSIVFLPCGHLVACAACSPALDNCPICREPIQGFIRTFIA